MALLRDDGRVRRAVVLEAWRANRILFGICLLKRNLKLCRRAGIESFLLECPRERREGLERALASEGGRSAISIVDSLSSPQALAQGFAPGAPCLVLRGDIVFLGRDLKRLLDSYARAPRRSVQLAVDGGARFAVGPLAQTLAASVKAAREPSASGTPFAADGLVSEETHGRADRRPERALARALRFESTDTDTFLARVVDRRISWPITYMLARTAVTPNQVTLANTVLGLLGAGLLAAAGYGWRVAGAALFVWSIIIDGVDGELARVKMMESASGERLDHITDNLVHVAVFCGIALGVYRRGHAPATPYVLGALLIGFGLCAVAVRYASRRLGKAFNADWRAKLERITGRDFAYLVLILALLDRLEYFIWGTALGTYAAALLFYGLAKVQGHADHRQRAREPHGEAAAEKYL